MLSACLAMAAFAEGPVLAEAWVVADPARLQALGRRELLLDEGWRFRDDGTIEQRVLASHATLDALRAEGLPVQVTRADHRRGAPPTGIHDPDTAAELLGALAARTPRGSLAVWGHSVEGRPLHALRLGQPPHGPAPSFRVLGGHHGDEWSSFELVLAVAATLAEGDGTDPRITAILDRATVWIVPIVNPDGVVRGSRFNASSVDLNRNYGYAWSAGEWGAGPVPFSEPETRAVRAQAVWDQPMASLSVHAGATNIGFVWNHTEDPAPDATTLREIAEDYASVVDDPAFWVTNGAAWYITHGDTNDWSYGRFGGMDYTLEVTADKAPPPDELAELLPPHVDATIAFLAAVPSVSGVVVDAESGSHVAARLQPVDDDDDAVGQPFYADPESGAFARIGSAPVRLHVSAPGYADAIWPTPSDGRALPLEPLRISGARLTPTVLVNAGVVELPSVASSVLLDRPGSAPVLLPATGTRVAVDPAQLQGGAWTVTAADGAVYPNALLIEDATTAAVEEVFPGTALELQGVGFAPGTRAWALHGSRRAARPLPLVSEDATTLFFDLAGVPTEGIVDVLVLTDGQTLAVADLWQSDDASVSGPPPILVGRACACTSGAGHPFVPLLSLWIAAMLCRRPRGTKTTC